MVEIRSRNSLHCPRCGQSFHAEKNRGEHSVYDFICSVCSFKFQRKYDSRRGVYLPSRIHSSLPELTEKSEIENRHYDPIVEAIIEPIADAIADPIAARLKQKWQEVLENFNTSEFHAQFIDLSQQLGRLELAKERYDYLKQALGEDPEVDKRIRQIEMKLLQRQVVMERMSNEDQKIPYWRHFATLFMVAILLGLVGTLLPELRWASFLGVLILAGLLFHRIKK